MNWFGVHGFIVEKKMYPGVVGGDVIVILSPPGLVRESDLTSL